MPTPATHQAWSARFSRWALTLLVAIVIVPLTPGQVRSRTARTPEQALAAFREVADQPEATRQKQVSALGYHATPEIDALLIAELKRAQTPSYKQAVVRALGLKRRVGVLPLLTAILDEPGTPSTLLYRIADAIGGQGEAAVPVLQKRLADPGANYGTVSALLRGLRRVGTPAAFAAILDAARDSRNASPVLQNLHGAPVTAAVTAFRVECLDHAQLNVQIQALTQLSQAGYPDLKAGALRVYRSIEGKPASGHYAAQLAAVFAGLLAPDTYAPFVAITAGAYGRLDKILEPLRGKVDTYPGFVDWLLSKGLERKIPAERLTAMRLLCLSKDPRIGEVLIKMVTSRQPGMPMMAIRALATRGDKQAVPILRRALKAKGEARQVAALEALHALLKDEPAWREELVTVFRGGKLKQRVLAMDLLAGMQRQDLLPEVHRLLSHKAWLMRAAAYDYCRVVRNLDSVSPLIARIDAEKGRLREDCLDALKAITSYRMFSSARWRSWWKESRETFKMPTVAQATPKKRPAAATVSSFFNIPLVSNRVTFVIDVSGSMSAGMSTVSSSGKFSNIRIEEAKRQLTRVVGELPKDAVFNVVYFESRVKAFAKAARKATKRTKSAALGFVRSLKATGGTNIHDAMELAFTDGDVDTIYLLSDGAPSAGKITDATQLANEIARWNKIRRIRIHTIAIGGKSELMERLAKESGGVHSYVR